MRAEYGGEHAVFLSLRAHPTATIRGNDVSAAIRGGKRGSKVAHATELLVSRQRGAFSFDLEVAGEKVLAKLVLLGGALGIGGGAYDLGIP